MTRGRRSYSIEVGSILQQGPVMLCSVRIANIGRERALEIATEYIENGVRRATGDCGKRYLVVMRGARDDGPTQQEFATLKLHSVRTDSKIVEILK